MQNKKVWSVRRDARSKTFAGTGMWGMRRNVPNHDGVPSRMFEGSSQ